MKRIIKTIFNLVSLLIVLPLYLVYRVSGLVLTPRIAFPGGAQLLSLVPGFLGTYLRRAYFRLVSPRFGKDVCISFGVIFSHPTVEFGNTVYIGPYCCLGDVTLQDDVLIGSHVSITNGSAQHGTERLDIPMREQPGLWPRVTIGEDTWIGDRAVVMADVGKKCIIGAGSVVTSPIPDYAIAVGVPARILRFRNETNSDTNSTSTDPDETDQQATLEKSERSDIVPEQQNHNQVSRNETLVRT
ncbi:MAG: acyltransferase [Gemmataceae bacterium]